MTVQLEYINHLLQFFKNISYYAGIMLNAFSNLLCWHNRLVPNIFPLHVQFTAVCPRTPNDRLTCYE